MPDDSRSHDEAREFLGTFLLRLQSADETNRQLVGVLSTIVQQNQVLAAQNQALLQQLAGMGAQVDTLAQHAAYLYDQMGRLGQVLLQDDPSAQLPPFQPGPAGLPSLGQAIGYGLDQVMGQPGGRRRRRG